MGITRLRRMAAGAALSLALAALPAAAVPLSSATGSPDESDVGAGGVYLVVNPASPAAPVEAWRESNGVPGLQRSQRCTPGCVSADTRLA